MNRPKRSKDYRQIREKVQRAALLIAEGKSEKSAAWEVDLPRASLQRYLEKGILPDGLPIWPDNPTEQSILGSTTGAPDGAQGNDSLPLICPSDENDKPEPVGGTDPGHPPEGRDSKGRFLPGNTEARKFTGAARRAKSIFAEACPEVAQKLINIFYSLPAHRPDLILAFGKEILDRGLGKPTQAIEVREESVSAELIFVRSVIEHADEGTIRKLQGLAVDMEEYARSNGGASVSGQMAIIPPPGGTLHNLDPGIIRKNTAPDNHDATAAR